ncbi:unnamed protein product, partial [Symbiodinium sp. CCMP2456]
MDHAQIIPDRVNYSAAMSACEKGSRWQLALSIFELLPRRSLGMDVTSVNTTLSSCMKGWQWKMSLELLSYMPKAKLLPDTISYSLSISACGKEAKWQHSLQLLESMPEKEVIPDVICYSAAIGSCSRGAEWQRALKLFHGLPSASFCPNIITYNEVLTCLHTAEEVKEMGYILFKQAMQQGFYSRLLQKGAQNLDVHEMSPGAAVLAVRWWLSEVLPTVLKKDLSLCRVITGWGKSRKAWRDSDVKAAVAHFLSARGFVTASQELQ